MVSVFKEKISTEIFNILLKSAQLFLDGSEKKALDELLIIHDPHIVKGISIKLLIENLLNDNINNVKILISNAKTFSKFIIKKIMLKLYLTNNINFINIMQKICKNDYDDIYLTALLLDGKYKEAMLFYDKNYLQLNFIENKSNKVITKFGTTIINHNVKYELDDSTADNINSYRVKYGIKDDIINMNILKIYISIFNNLIDKYTNIDKIINIYKINKFAYSSLSIDIFEQLFFKLAKKLLDDKDYEFFVLLMKQKYNEYYYNEKYELLIKEYFDLTGLTGFDKSEWGLKYTKLCESGIITKNYNNYLSLKIKQIKINIDSEIIKLAQKNEKEKLLNIIINTDNTYIFDNNDYVCAISKLYNFDEIQQIYKILILKSIKKIYNNDLIKKSEYENQYLIKELNIKSIDLIKELDIESIKLKKFLLFSYISNNFSSNLISLLVNNKKIDDGYKLFKLIHGVNPSYCCWGESGSCCCVLNFDIKTYPLDYLNIWLSDHNFLLNFNHWMKKFNTCNMSNYKEYIEIDKIKDKGYTDIFLLNFAGFDFHPSIKYGEHSERRILD